MTTAVDIPEFQDHLHEYLRKAADGEKVVILRNDQPLVEMQAPAGPVEFDRPFGLAHGEFVTPDDFDAPLPDGVLKLFDGLS